MLFGLLFKELKRGPHLFLKNLNIRETNFCLQNCLPLAKWQQNFWSKFFAFIIDPFSEEKQQFDRFTSPESVSIDLKGML